jgi:hypothetical protein
MFFFLQGTPARSTPLRLRQRAPASVAKARAVAGARFLRLRSVPRASVTAPQKKVYVGGQGRVVSPLRGSPMLPAPGRGATTQPAPRPRPPSEILRPRTTPTPTPTATPTPKAGGGGGGGAAPRLEPRSKPRGPPRAPLGAFRPQTPEQYLNNSDPVSSTTRSDIAENGDIESAEVYIVPASGRLLTLPASHTRQRDGTSSQSDLIHRSCRLHSNPTPLPPHPRRCRSAAEIPSPCRREVVPLWKSERKLSAHGVQSGWTPLPKNDRVPSRWTPPPR